MIRKWWVFGLVALLAAAGCGDSIPADGEYKNTSAVVRLDADEAPIPLVEIATTDMTNDLSIEFPIQSPGRITDTSNETTTRSRTAIRL